MLEWLYVRSRTSFCAISSAWEQSRPLRTVSGRDQVKQRSGEYRIVVHVAAWFVRFHLLGFESRVGETKET